MSVGKVRLLTREPYPFEDSVEVPRRVATCPYCGATLWADAWEWEELRSGRMAVTGIQTHCAAEPPLRDGDMGDWDDWWESHRQMPYVFLLPVEQRVLRWMRRSEVASRYTPEPAHA